MNCQVLDDIFMGINYTVASVDINDSLNDSIMQINAIGRLSAVCDKTQILQYLAGYGIQVTGFSLNLDRNISSVATIGSRAATHIMGPEEITIRVTCYTTSVPSNIPKPKPLPVPDDSSSFDLKGAL